MKKVIWQSCEFYSEKEVEKIYNELAQEMDYEDLNEMTYEEKVKVVSELLDADLEDDLMNLEGVEAKHELVITGTANVWDGEWFVFQELDTTNIGKSLQAAVDGASSTIRMYVEGKELVVEVSHHDGTNKYLIREWKAEMTDRKFENLYKKLDSALEVKDRLDVMKRYTKGAGEYVRNCYGF